MKTAFYIAEHVYQLLVTQQDFKIIPNTDQLEKKTCYLKAACTSLIDRASAAFRFKILFNSFNFFLKTSFY